MQRSNLPSPITTFLDDLAIQLQKVLPTCKIEKEIYKDEGEIHLHCSSGVHVFFYMSTDANSPFIECTTAIDAKEVVEESVFSGTYAIQADRELDILIDYLQVYDVLPASSNPEVFNAVQVFNELSNQSVVSAFNWLETEFHRHWPQKKDS